MATQHLGKERYTGQAYQLFSDHQVSNGSYVAVNGPWDTYGIVTSSAKQDDGRWLNQIRGTRPRVGEKPVAQF